MVLSLRKGKAFEREVAKKLTEITGGKWIRVPASGAMATAQDIKDNRFRGDVFTENGMFSAYVIECKISKKPITLENVVSKDSLLWKWIEQAETEAGTSRWVLIFRYAHSPMFILSEDVSTVSLFKADKIISIKDYVLGVLI